MSISEIDLAEIAARHGVDLDAVKPLDKAERLNRLRGILDRQNVPFPIDPARANAYYDLYAQNVPFSIGSLSEETVQLNEYANEQTHDNYTQIEHLSWACLIADQQVTKHQYACREY